MHVDRIIIAVLSLIGMASTFMPWIYYPRINEVLYGHYGAGVITGVFCLFCFLASIVSFKVKESIKLLPLIIILLLSFFVVYYVVFSYFDLQESIKQVDKNDPYALAAAAGVRFDYGIYILGLSMALSFTFVAFRIVQKLMQPEK